MARCRLIMEDGAPRRWGLVAVMAVAVVGLAGCAESAQAEELTAEFAAEPAEDGMTVRFDASGSSGAIREYEWFFGDGTNGQGTVTEKTYNVTDTMVYVSLRVVGEAGATATTYQEVPLGDGKNEAPAVELADVNRWVPPDETVRLRANVSDADGDDVELRWVFGTIPPEEPPEARYATGTLAPGGEAEGRFDLEGVYVLVSGEHEWMRTRLVVDGDSGAPDNVTVAIRNNAIHDGATVRLAPGGTLRFVNEDPTNRSIRVAYAAFGTDAGSEPSFTTPSLASGSYQATVILDDGKGGLTLRSWGVRASTDAPVLPDASYEDETVVQQGEHLHHAFPGDVLFPARVWGNATWVASPAPEPQVHLAIVASGTEQAVGPEATCDSEVCRLTGMLGPGSYEWEIEFEQGLFESYEIETSYYVFGVPERGDDQWSRPHGHGWGF